MVTCIIIYMIDADIYSSMQLNMTLVSVASFQSFSSLIFLSGLKATTHSLLLAAGIIILPRVDRVNREPRKVN